MKLTKEYFFSDTGAVSICENGWLELRRFSESIIYKYVGAKPYAEDLISASVIACVEALPNYDPLKNNQLGGWMFWRVRGVISKAACANKHEIPVDWVTGEPDV